MKKTLSILLAVCMIFAFVPFIAFAEDQTIELSQDMLGEPTTDYPDALNYALRSGVSGTNTYVIPADTTIVVPTGKTLQIVNSSALIVEEGGTLVLSGNCIVHEQGTLKVDGNITNADKITNNGVAVARIVFPSLQAAGLAGKLEVSYASSYSGSAYDDLGGGLTYTGVDCTYEDVAKYVPLNQYIYIIAHIIEPVQGRDQFDDAKMKVRLNGVEIPYTQTNHHTLLTTGGKISYSQWTNDDDFLNTYKIDLPNKEGVTVVGREGEVGSTDTTVYIKYGKPFSFRVDLDDAYSKSPIEVYIVSGYGWTNMDTSTILADLEPAQPDADGYYNIPSVQSDYTVFVMGVIANETVEKVGGIFEQVKGVFEMIKKFFNQFLALFGLSL